ncbi:hypothetical protein [Nocardia sp. NPDC060249]|uniref:hypothetical protein n=1 Tax=Nocardia sp. NPDC060249 TaxID=3347082 RepID=UPI00365F9234
MTDTVDIPPTESRWWDYVEDLQVANGMKTVTAVAEKIGIPPSTVYAWKSGAGSGKKANTKVDAETARLVAYKFDRPVLEVFFNAGLLAREDVAEDRDVIGLTTEDLTDEALLQDLARRFQRLKTENELLRNERPQAEEPEAPAKAPSTLKRKSTRVARRPEGRA